MRGGSIPLLAWGTLLVILLAINWIWTGDAIQVGSFAVAALTVFAGAVVLALIAPRQALRRGPPPDVPGPEAVPHGSAGAVLAGLGVSSILFGFVFGTFPIYFGIGLLVLAAGRLWIEFRAERESRAQAALRLRREPPR